MVRPKSKPPTGAKASPVKLVAFHDTCLGAGFSFSRYYWDGVGSERESIVPKIEAKRRPVRSGANGGGDTAAAVHVILPDDAPNDYMRIDFLPRHYEGCLPDTQSVAYVQVTLKFPEFDNLHRPFEIARSWVKSYYAEERGLPVILVLHDPSLAASESVGHAHALILPRRVSRRGWGGMARDLGSDAARSAAKTSWDAWLANRK